MGPLVTVVVPSHRGAPRLEALAARLIPVADQLRGDLVLVDDGSEDGTWEAMVGLAAAHPNVSCVRMEHRCGQQVATLAGCSLARGRWIVTLDDDLEHDPRDIPRLLGRAREGYELVYAVPRARPLRSLRSVGSRLFDLAFRLLIGKPSGVRLTSYRIMSAALVARMLADRVPVVYVSALALRQRPRTGTVAVDLGPRAVSRTPLRRLVVTFVRTILGYSVLGRLGRAVQVLRLLPIAEARRAPG